MVLAKKTKKKKQEKKYCISSIKTWSNILKQQQQHFLGEQKKCNLLNKATPSNPFGPHANVCHINTAEGATRHANPQFRLKHITRIHVPDLFKCMYNYPQDLQYVQTSMHTIVSFSLQQVI